MITRQIEGALWRLTIDRTDKANALTGDMLQALSDHVAQATNEGAAALILTGRGKVFSAGADLEAAKAGLAVNDVWEELSGRIAAFPGLSIAALNGTVAGGAMGMVLACDIRLSVHTAKFFYPVMKLGYAPQPSDGPRMTALIGPARTKMILMAAQKIEAPEALAWGLIDRIVEGDVVKEAELLCAATLASSKDIRQTIKARCT